jgi:short subunit dehydrogenase-like uncharacterized protein
VNRIIVAGARGFFGSALIRIFRAEGAAPLTASRRAGCELILDVEQRASIRASIRPHDVIVDATAPFQTRTAALVDEAIAIGADVVDLSDSLAYARLVLTRDEAARDRGVRVLNACSSVSVLSALAIARSGVSNPVALHGFLAPATRHTANRGAAESLLASVNNPIAVRRGGELVQARGWGESREFRGLGRRGRLVEMADAVTLARVYPSLSEVDFWVDPNTRGAAVLLGLIARVPSIAPFALRFARYGVPLAKVAGSDVGVLAYEVEGPRGERSTVVFTGRESFLMAAVPSALSAMRLASGQPYPSGVLPVDQHLDANRLVAALNRYGITIHLDPRNLVGRPSCVC